MQNSTSKRPSSKEKSELSSAKAKSHQRARIKKPQPLPKDQTVDAFDNIQIYEPKNQQPPHREEHELNTFEKGNIVLDQEISFNQAREDLPLQMHEVREETEETAAQEAYEEEKAVYSFRESSRDIENEDMLLRQFSKRSTTEEGCESNYSAYDKENKLN